VRPDDDDLDEGFQQFASLLDRLASLESFQELDRGKSTREFRLPRKEGGKAHLLFRPVGQIALAGAMGNLVFDQHKDADATFRMLHDYERKDGFAIDDPSKPWWGVVYDPIGQKIARGGEAGAANILLWLLGGITIRKVEAGLA
jgi:hypothetical protein